MIGAAYLLENLSISFDFVWWCFAKDAIPKILHHEEVLLIEVIPGLVPGHAILNPVGKNDSLELFHYQLRKRIGDVFRLCGFGHLNFVLSQQ